MVNFETWGVSMKSKYVVLDFETTGVNRYHDDEVVQVAIINQDEEILINELCKPKHHFTWSNAQRVHGISPSMVKDKPSFESYIDMIKNIFDSCDFIVCYNIAFEQGILKNYGMDISKYKFRDPMKEFAPIYGEVGYRGGYKWQSLSTCAKYFGYSFEAHDALEDVKATRFCFEQIKSYNINKERINQAYLDSWKLLFKPWIIERGIKYYQDGLVDLIYKGDEQIVASVDGSTKYMVSIELDKNKIKKIACDCPHASGGSNCKHMAAVLLKINE